MTPPLQAKPRMKTGVSSVFTPGCTSFVVAARPFAAGIAADRNSAADSPRNADRLRVGDLARHAATHGLVGRVAFLPANRVRNPSGAVLRDIAANRVRNPLAANLFHIGAGRVGHAFGDAFHFVRADSVGNPLVTGFISVSADRVRNASRAAFPDPGASRVGHAFGGGAGNPATHRVRNLAVLHFRDVPRAADFLLDGLRAPDAAAGGAAGTLVTFHFARAGLVDAAASTGIPFPRSRLADASLLNRAGDVFRDGFPFSAFHVDPLHFGDRFADGIADVAVAGLSHGAVGRAGHIAVAGFVDRTGNRVGAIAVAGLAMNAANLVADVTVAGAVNRPANFATHRAIACLVDRSANCVADLTVACLANRHADFVRFGAVAGPGDHPGAGHRNLLTHRVVNRLGTGDLSFLPNGFFHHFVGCFAALSSGAIVAGRSASGLRTTIVTDRAAVAGLRRLRRDAHQYQSRKQPPTTKCFHLSASFDPMAIRGSISLKGGFACHKFFRLPGFPR